LIVSLLVFIETERDNKYQKIIKILKYLINDVEIPFENIKFTSREITCDDKVNKTTEYNGIN
jgi:uncharacterized protein (UPF0147 family)